MEDFEKKKLGIPPGGKKSLVFLLMICMQLKLQLHWSL